jgi:hypothetical protein
MIAIVVNNNNGNYVTKAFFVNVIAATTIST